MAKHVVGLHVKAYEGCASIIPGGADPHQKGPSNVKLVQTEAPARPRWGVIARPGDRGPAR